MDGLVLGGSDDWERELAAHPELFATRIMDADSLEGAQEALAAELERVQREASESADEDEAEPSGAPSADESADEWGEVLAGFDVVEGAGLAFARERTPDAGRASGAQREPEPEPEERPRFFDLHCDTLDRLCLGAFTTDTLWSEQDRRIPEELRTSLAHNACHIALDRLAEQAHCQCFAVFIPDEFRGEEAWRLFQHVRTFFESQMAEHEALVEWARDARCVDAVVDGGKTAALLTVEGAGFLTDSTERVHEAAELGVKMMTLTWNGPNALGSGNETRDGLTPFGRRVVGEMERCRMVVDVSHLNDRGFEDLVEVATRPFVASHSNARSVCGHPRNLTDAQARLIFEGGGLVGLNFCREFLTEWHKDPTEDDVLRQVDRLLELGGERGLALGSDYDGTDVPSWLDGCERLPALRSLLARAFGEEIAERVCWRNARDFFARNEG